MLSFIKRLLGPAGQRTGRKATIRPTLECLEGRDLPSITLVNSTTLVARGDDGGVVHNDAYQLHIRPDNGHLQLVQSVGTSKIAALDVPAGVTQIFILGDGGTDTVRVEALPSRITLTVTEVEGFNVGNSHTLAGILGNMTLTTNSALAGSFGYPVPTTAGGPTAVTFAGDLDTADHSVTITRDGVSGLTPQGTLNYSRARLGSLNISTGSGTDAVYVLSTKAATTVNTGGGGDNVYVGYKPGGQSMSSLFNGDLAGLNGALTLDGGSLGQDQLFVSDGGSTLNYPVYMVFASSFTRTFTAVSINYSGFEQATFDTGGSGGYVVVRSTAAGVPTQVVTSSDVAVSVGGNEAGILNEIHGSLNVQAINTSGTQIPGGPLTLDDYLANTIAHNYTITRNGSVQVTREDGISITSSAMSEVGLYAGSAANTVTVVDTSNNVIPTPVFLSGRDNTDTTVMDTLIQQPSWGVKFVISGPGVGAAYGVTFTGFENLTGGAGNDTFAFQTNAQGVAGSLRGKIDGGGGINTLDYSALTTGVTVDLATRIATGAAGGIANIRNVTGSKGNDLLRGDASANVLLGVDGNDILIGLDDNDYLDACGIDGVGLGATRRNILIAGRGADTLLGSEGEDILIGGYFENNLDSNDAVLRAFMDVWKGTGDYYSRAYALNQNGVAVNGVTYKVNDNNIQRDDGATDVFYGYGGKHWYWVGGDDVDDRIAGVEYKNDLTL
jgi:hypothetical protein